MKFTILVTSDVHGHAERFSKLAHLIQQKQPALLIDNGDFIQGSHLSYYYERVKCMPHPLIALANELHYDVAVFGNHEFNYSLEEIENMRNACHFPWIAGNIGDFAKPYFIKEIEDIRVAVVGVVTHHVPLWDDQQITKDLSFTNALTAAKHWVQIVREREQADMVILSYHGGLERDVKTGIPYDEENGENQGYAMLQEIEGIDLLITGHQHLQVATKVGSVSVVQPGANAHCLAQIDVTVENGLISHEPSLLFVDEDSPATIYADLDAWLQTAIGYIASDMTYTQFMEPRLADHPYLQLLHQIQLKNSSAQISVTELFYNTTGGFKDNVTILDVLKNYPRTNTLKVIELTGAEIRQALELCAAVFAIDENGDIGLSTVIHSPKLQPYIYDVWGGIDYELKISRDVGERVTKLQYQGQPIHEADSFKVVVNSYRWTGAHGFTMMNKPPIHEIKIDVPQLIMRYLKEHSPIQSSDEKHWQVVK